MNVFGCPLASVANNIVNSFNNSPRAPDPPYYTIPPPNCSYDADSWWRGICKGIQSFQDRDNVTISKVRWFKNISGLCHESLVFTINVSHPRDVAYLVIERSTRKELIEIASRRPISWSELSKCKIVSLDYLDKKRAIKAIQMAFNRELKLIEERGAGSSSGPVFADGNPAPGVALARITRVYPDYGVRPISNSLGLPDATCLQILTFDKDNAPKFLLRDLCIMVREIHNRRPSHSLYKHNSYWFARSLVDVIVMMKRPTTETPNAYRYGLAGCLIYNELYGPLVTSNLPEVNALTVRIGNAIRNDDKRIGDLQVSDESASRLTPTEEANGWDSMETLVNYK